MNTEFREKAKDFGAALKSSPSIAAYFLAQKKMEADQETQELISQFQEKQKELWLNQRSRKLTPEEIKSFRELQEKIIDSPIIREFSLAQTTAFELCRSVAGKLSELLGVDFGMLISPPSSC